MGLALQISMQYSTEHYMITCGPFLPIGCVFSALHNALSDNALHPGAYMIKWAEDDIAMLLSNPEKRAVYCQTYREALLPNLQQMADALTSQQQLFEQNVEEWKSGM